MPSFTHLATRTAFSLRDGVIRPAELAEAVAARGMTAVGVADRGGLYGAVRVAQACARNDVRPIFGADLALSGVWPGWEGTREPGAVPGRRPAEQQRRPAEHQRSPGPGAPLGQRAARALPGSGAAWLTDDAARVVVIARDRRGYGALCRLVTDHHLESARGDPHATWGQLERRLGSGAGEVFVLLGDDSPVGRLLDAGRVEAAAAEARRWMELVGRDAVLLGVTHHLAAGDHRRARARFALAEALGIRAVAHQAARYLDPADARIADVMDAVRQQVPLGSLRNRRNAEGYLKTPKEMAAVFAERPDALAATAWVAERCEVDLELGRLRVPDFVAVAGDPGAELRRRCESGVAERYGGGGGTRHRELLDTELAMVARLGLAPYFLTVAQIVERIREKGIMAACRGSAAGSIIAYALRISDVDPVAHDLVFERFMNPYRDELPDIDIDVESARREDIYRDLLDRYGEDRVACVAMLETFKARMAIREVGKCLGLPPGEVDVIAKSFPRVRARDVRAALEHLPEMRGLNLSRPDLAMLFDVVERMDSLPRHIALHPSGVLLADATLRDLVPMERSAAGFAMAQFDKDDVEALGLCKLDVLSVRMLSAMSHAVDEVRRVRGADVDLASIPSEDPATYELIRSTRTIGMFQIESPGQRELVGKFQPEHVGDLVADISLFRPGPVKGDMITTFLARRHAVGGAAATLHPLLERALGETYGVIVYHEQVMRCVAAVTGCDLSTADLVRRRLSDVDQLDAIRAWFMAGAAERAVPPEVAKPLWHALAQFASFGFCKAHAAAFAVPTYRSAWLKAHHCPEFVAGLLTHDPGMYPRRLILDDARQFGIAVLPLDVNRSDRVYRVERLPAVEAYRLLGLRPAPGPPSPPPSPSPSAGCAVDAISGINCTTNAAAGEAERATAAAAAAGEAERATAARAAWAVPDGWRVDGAGDPQPPAGFDYGVDPGDPAWRFGVRLALQDVAGIDDAMIDSVLTARPFTSIEDLRRRAALSQPVVEALAHTGALDELGGVGLPPAGAASDARPRTRRDLLLEVGERWARARRPRPSTRARLVGATAPPVETEQLSLLPAAGPPGLPEYRPSERVRAELEVLGLDASTHVVRFYEGLLAVLGVTRAVDLEGTRNRQRVRIAGVKIATQTPPVKSGQRIIFLSLDDGTGIGDATFFESVHDRCAWTVFHSWLLVVEGCVHRTGRRGISLNAERVWDLRRLMHAWREGQLDDALIQQPPADPATGRGAGSQVWDRGSPARIEGAAGHSGLRVAAADDRSPAASSRVGPNGATWADPAGRHPGVDPGDVGRLARSDPRHPEHVAAETDEQAPRKLWHSSGGSAGG